MLFTVRLFIALGLWECSHCCSYTDVSASQSLGIKGCLGYNLLLSKLLLCYSSLKHISLLVRYLSRGLSGSNGVIRIPSPQDSGTINKCLELLHLLYNLNDATVGCSVRCSVRTAGYAKACSSFASHSTWRPISRPLTSS